MIAHHPFVRPFDPSEAHAGHAAHEAWRRMVAAHLEAGQPKPVAEREAESRPQSVKVSPPRRACLCRATVARGVRDLYTGTGYPSARAAAAATGVLVTSIRTMAGDRAAGRERGRWEWIRKGESAWLPPTPNDLAPPLRGRARRVIDTRTGAMYDSADAAGKALGLSAGYIGESAAVSRRGENRRFRWATRADVAAKEVA